ncbi:hypothetical protein BS50DRAFT_327249 [Corynespora cassiicola Philippines]|uniref:Uncharacterized protein n=1 Tax=Corynespora cassiicola Philippines TaxID=1448308 RepID=A0A2T2NUW7_CORCC|nr:hypothetical protein BS50DRAFT_327249 [Corynespora cassiicola Philippines]
MPVVRLVGGQHLDPRLAVWVGRSRARLRSKRRRRMGGLQTLYRDSCTRVADRVATGCWRPLVALRAFWQVACSAGMEGPGGDPQALFGLASQRERRVGGRLRPSTSGVAALHNGWATSPSCLCSRDKGSPLQVGDLQSGQDPEYAESEQPSGPVEGERVLS